jgi:hypothetical protein
MGAWASNLLSRLQNVPLRENLPNLLGRFSGVRSVYGRTIGGFQRVGTLPGITPAQEEVVRGPRPAALVEALERESAHIGLELSSETVDAIVTASRALPLRQWFTLRQFRFEDVHDGRLLDGSPALIADVLGVDGIAAARAVAHSPRILSALEHYMHYRPLGVDVRVLASFAGDFSDDTWRAYGQTLDFQFDIHGFSFIDANYYLTDVDASSGAHVLVHGTHRKKPLSWLLGQPRRSDDEVARVYASENVRTIAGPRGLGFLQDSSCYHKALPPKTRDCLLLHIRYY